ncbi:hypothetical protein PICMEDRAFT_13478 [Pichia membranifaciens NRRL Y-2026]|uniref:Mediator of RNA polymerase II transcription subunit 8 n=1 Tax=Pichia membranifaciens NRRL Y-2026 TaxID=763406 RepID=A0A1E3NFC0_9ASCO|nr:hypothetical protein PICMEDRAFT_13478 [Pichia membranifaciens NRRL Y-2026]ODQ44819.1 hypothetical protein PICMEDRAFT_13478 [Pichia membranifaciens NRRL Y-2026]
MSVPPAPVPATQQAFPPLNFEDTPVEDLEQLRPRLTQLTHSLRKLEEALRVLHYTQSNAELTAIQNQFNVILQQLASLSRTLQAHKEILQVTNVFPNREFNTMSGLLFNLLRKKLTPEVEEWIKNATQIATAHPPHSAHSIPPSTATSTVTQNTINTAAATTNSHLKSSADADALETLLFRDDQLTDEYVEYAHTTLEDYMFGGYLTKSEIDSGLKISDVLKNVKKEDLESPMSSPSPIAASSPSPSGPPVAERDLLRFIYQGLDSNVSLK